jgi:hypothetical protein
MEHEHSDSSHAASSTREARHATVMAEMQDLFDQVAGRMVSSDADVELGRALASEGLKVRGKLFGFVWKEKGIVVKLPADRVAELIASGEGGVFDRGRGTPMREWVCVRPDDAAGCEAYLREARDFVAAHGRAG